MFAPLPFALHARTGEPAHAELALSLAAALREIDADAVDRELWRLADRVPEPASEAPLDELRSVGALMPAARPSPSPRGSREDALLLDTALAHACPHPLAVAIAAAEAGRRRGFALGIVSNGTHHCLAHGRAARRAAVRRGEHEGRGRATGASARIPQLGSRAGSVGSGRKRMRSSVAVLVALLAALVVAQPAAADYVALGDSYTAGPVIPLQIQPYGCLKSNNNYAHLAQSRLAQPAFRDPSCSGAETEDMTQEQGVSPGPNPPQFDSLDADTQIVTLGIGGNDIGFSGIAEDCFQSQPSNGSPCKDQYTAGGQDEVSRRIAETAPKVGAVLQGIHSRSPQARVLVVNYPAIFPHEGGGCWPQLPVAEGDVVWLREKQVELNQMLAGQAAANSAGLVDWYEASRGHDACQLPAIRWVEPAAPVNAAAPMHPNLGGMMGASDLVVAAAQQHARAGT